MGIVFTVAPRKASQARSLWRFQGLDAVVTRDPESPSSVSGRRALRPQISVKEQDAQQLKVEPYFNS